MEPVQFFLMIPVKLGGEGETRIGGSIASVLAITPTPHPQSSPSEPLEGDLLGLVGAVHVGLPLLPPLGGPRLLQAADRTFSTGEDPGAWRADGKGMGKARQCHH